jgi:hypothetical protein
MLNKGPFVLDAISMLDDVLTRMEAHQIMKDLSPSRSEGVVTRETT